MAQAVLIERIGQVGMLTLNRPEALNALNLEMIETIGSQLAQWKNDPELKAVILQATPGRAFCAGGDIRSLYDAGLRQDPDQLRFFRQEYQMNLAIHEFNKPFIALMDGITMGGGVGVAMHGSFPVASERFVFAMPETGIGFFPDIGASHLLTGCPEATGIYLGLTGNRLNAQEAYSLGLVKQVISAQDFPKMVEALVSLDYSKDSYHAVEHCLKSYGIKPSQKFTDLPHYQALNQAFSAQTVEAILENLSSLDENWALDLYQILQQKSPLSLKVTLAQLHKARGLSLEQCLQMDYCLVSHFMQDHDFYEGVRALIVDKDKNPKWQPESLAEVSSEKVLSYFQV